MRLLVFAFAATALMQARQPLVVVSVDGLDNRYLTNTALRIPNIRRLMREGQVSEGVIGVVPTITWPSHTTMITGADPVAHGILGNWRPPGEKFLDYSQIKVPALIGAAHQAGLKIATIDWPVTVGAPADWNIPEYFQRRRGGGMDRHSAQSKTVPAGLFDRIAADYPSILQEFMDDRARTLATIWILQHYKPDFLLLHLVDLDAEAHENAPFTPEANATVELTDEFIGQIVRAMPAGAAFALVSDHGFERVHTAVNLQSAAAAMGVTDLVQSGGTVTAPDARAAEALRQLAKDPRYGIGREIPKAELAKFPSNIPADAAAVFESAEGFQFSPQGPESTKPAEIGNHGHWPMRYRAVFVLWGAGIKPSRIPEISIKEHAARFAQIIGVPFPGAAPGNANPAAVETLTTRTMTFDNNTPGRITGIGGIFFKAADDKALKAWYASRLGIPAGPEGFPWRDHAQPDVEHLTVWSIFPAATKYFNPSPAPFMVNYIVDDMDAFLKKCEAGGVSIEKREDHEYGRFAWIFDLEGNKIELWQPPRK